MEKGKPAPTKMDGFFELLQMAYVVFDSKTTDFGQI